MDYIDYFKDKKITVMGLGLLGRGVGDTEFLAECGADLIVTDLKSKEELAPSLERLKKYSAKGGSASGGKNICYVLGEHRKEDFEGRDMILMAAGVPYDSPYIEHARKHKIPIEMSASLLFKLSGALAIGVTGTRGKTTVTHLIAHILESAGKRVHLGGNIRGKSTLALLSEVKPEDFLVLELDSWQLQGFGESKISPQIAVFTNFMEDHLNYYKGDMNRYFEDKANIFKFQQKDDVIVTTPAVAQRIQKDHKDIPSTFVITDGSHFPKAWRPLIPGLHNLDNLALAIETARVLKVPDEKIKSSVESFIGVEGRLQKIASIKGVDIYNDTTATTPHATLAGLKSVSDEKNVILIMGGADKGIDMAILTDEIPNFCKEVVFLSGTGTEKVKNMIQRVPTREFDSLPKALQYAISKAEEGDVILFSPAFASFGMFKNEYDRGDQFNQLVGSLQ